MCRHSRTLRRILREERVLSGFAPFPGVGVPVRSAGPRERAPAAASGAPTRAGRSQCPFKGGLSDSGFCFRRRGEAAEATGSGSGTGVTVCILRLRPRETMGAGLPLQASFEPRGHRDASRGLDRPARDTRTHTRGRLWKECV